MTASLNTMIRKSLLSTWHLSRFLNEVWKECVLDEGQDTSRAARTLTVKAQLGDTTSEAGSQSSPRTNGRGEGRTPLP